MKTCTYNFNDGTSETVEVTDEMYETLMAMDKEERLNNRKNTRRKVSLDAIVDHGGDLEDPDSDPFEIFMKKQELDKLKKAISKLTPSQQELIELVFFEKKRIVDIAAEYGVFKTAITNRLARIYKKLQQLLQ